MNRKVRIYGAVVELPLDIDLPLLPVAPAEMPHLQVRLGSLEVADFRYELDDAVVIEYHENAVAVVGKIELGPRTLEHYVVDHAIPMGLTATGRHVLHAAGLSFDSIGIVVTGPSGFGKSTLTAFLVSSGWRSLGDDAVGLTSVDGICVMHPSYPGIRLFPGPALESLTTRPAMAGTNATSPVAEYGPKQRVVLCADEFQPDQHVVSHLIALGNDDEFRVMRLGAAEVCSLLANQMFYPSASSADAMRRLFEVSVFTGGVTGYRIDYPRTEDGLCLVRGWLAREVVDRTINSNSKPVSWNPD